MIGSTTKMAFPTTAPGSGATVTLLSLTGNPATTAKRIILTLRSSHISAASGLAFESLLDGGGTTYRNWTSYTHPAATASDPDTTYLIAVPQGATAIKIEYTNSASVLTSWEGSLAVDYDQGAAP